MMDEHREIVVITVLQVMVVIVGWFATGIHLKWNGYPDIPAGLVITKHALWIREHGLVLLWLPVVWLIGASTMELSRRFAQPKVAYVSIGVVMTVTLTIVLVLIAADVVYRPLPWFHLES